MSSHSIDHSYSKHPDPPKITTPGKVHSLAKHIQVHIHTIHIHRLPLYADIDTSLDSSNIYNGGKNISIKI